VKEPEGIGTPPPRTSLAEYLVKTLRTALSQCRGRGFESHHLHQSPSQGAEVEPRKEPLGRRVVCGYRPVPRSTARRTSEELTVPVTRLPASRTSANTLVRCHALKERAHRLLGVPHRDRTERSRDRVRGGGRSPFHGDGDHSLSGHHPGQSAALVGHRRDITPVQPQERGHARDGGVARHGWKGRRHDLPDGQVGQGALGRGIFLFSPGRGIDEESDESRP